MGDDMHAFRGRRVTVDPVHYPKLAGTVFTIAEARRPTGTDCLFVALCDPTGQRLANWIRDTELLPAPAITRQGMEKMNMSELESPTRVQNAATRFEQLVHNLVARGNSTREAFDLAQAQDAVAAEAYRLRGIDSAIAPAPTVVSLSAHVGESFEELVLRHQAERSISLRQAMHEVALAHPDLAESR